MAVSLVFFDLGGVAARFDPERRLAALAPLAGADPARIHEAVWRSGLSRDFDAGLYDADGMHARLCEVLGARLPRAELLRVLALAFEPAPEVLALARRVGRGARVGLLTNNPPLLREALPVHLGAIASGFDPIVFSYEVGALKPAPELYARVAERVGAGPGELALIDDSRANVDAARAAGWEGLHFTGAEALERALVARGLAPE